MTKKLFLGVLGILSLALAWVSPVAAQSSDFQVHLKRNFGYGGGANIRGTFTISVVGEDDAVESVVFLMDGEEMAVVSQTPFEFRFHTDDYGFGVHRLWAEVRLKSGETEITPSVQFNFVSPQEERRQITTLIGGIVGALAVTLALVAIMQALLFRGKRRKPTQSGQPRTYGALGGTICPQCGRPFPRHIWGLNLVTGRLDRCDHCGKWVWTTRATSEALRAAEAREAAETDPDVEIPQTHPEPTDWLEDTRFVDEV